MSWEFAGIMRGITSAVSWSTQRHILVNRHWLLKKQKNKQPTKQPEQKCDVFVIWKVLFFHAFWPMSHYITSACCLMFWFCSRPCACCFLDIRKLYVYIYISYFKDRHEINIRRSRRILPADCLRGLNLQLLKPDLVMQLTFALILASNNLFFYARMKWKWIPFF